MGVVIARIADLNEVLWEKGFWLAPSGVLPDGFMCDCDQLTIVRIRNDG